MKCDDCDGVGMIMDYVFQDPIKCSKCEGSGTLQESTKIENQLTISEWARETFGSIPSGELVTARCNEEMGELVTAVALKENIGQEAADVLVVLYQVAQHHGFDLHVELDKKMKINRARDWARGKKGTFQHVQ